METSLTQHEAVEAIDPATLDEWRSTGRRFQVLPSKLVHTVKARTGRLKARAVCCGNFETGVVFNKHETYAGGVCATSLRAVLRCCAAWGWGFSSFDVKTAFLQSDLIDAHDIPTIVKTPMLWRNHGICRERYWIVRRALYGLNIAPRSWCESRDKTMSEARAELLGIQVSFAKLECDPNIWRAQATVSGGAPVTIGYVLWYVDDALLAVEPSFLKSLTAFVGSLWTTTKPEYLDEVGILAYRGFELERKGEFLVLHQRSFTAELLLRYPGKEKSDLPIVPKSGELNPPPEEADPALVRKCQQLAGELLWLSTYTRPDLVFAVSAMTRLLSSRPREARSIGYQALRYLRKHPGNGLAYGPPPGDCGPEGAFVKRTLYVAEGITDASFAPQGERSHQCSMTFLGGSLITWTSQRQAFMTQSTAECELVGLAHVLSDLEAQRSLFESLLEDKVQCVLYCDNKATISICTTPFGSWRSRHLHVRANIVKEKLGQGWQLFHLPGRVMLADVGTKALHSSRLSELLSYIGLFQPEAAPDASTEPSTASGPAGASRAFKHQEVLKALVLLEVLDLLTGVEAVRSEAPGHEGSWDDLRIAFAIGFLSGVVFAAAFALILWTLKKCQPDCSSWIFRERRQECTASYLGQVDSGLASISQVVVEEPVRRLMFVNGPRAWLELCSTCQVFRQFRGNLNNYGNQSRVVDSHMDPQVGLLPVSAGIVEALDFTRVRLRLDGFWGEARYSMWAQVQRTNTRMLELARQQLATLSATHQVTSSRPSALRASRGVLRPDYEMILGSDDPRFQADWMPYLDRWEAFFEEPGFDDVPADVAREEAFHDHGIDYDQGVLDAWTFRRLYGREHFVTEVTRRRQLRSLGRPNNRPPEPGDQSSDDSLPPPSSFGSQFDFQVASAAHFLVRHGYVFDWENNLDPAQQDLYHEITGNRMLEMHRGNLSD